MADLLKIFIVLDCFETFR